jgi:hypothetical protein
VLTAETALENAASAAATAPCFVVPAEVTLAS